MDLLDELKVFYKEVVQIDVARIGDLEAKLAVIREKFVDSIKSPKVFDRDPEVLFYNKIEDMYKEKLYNRQLSRQSSNTVRLTVVAIMIAAIGAVSQVATCSKDQEMNCSVSFTKDTIFRIGQTIRSNVSSSGQVVIYHPEYKQ